MKIACIRNKTIYFPENYLEYGYSDNTEFDLVTDNQYIVYAVSFLRGGVIQYLIIGESSKNPSWYPALLFNVTDSRIPGCWHNAFWGHDPENRVLTIFGFKEIVERDDYFDQLAEMEASALKLFFEKKNEIDQEFI